MSIHRAVLLNETIQGLDLSNKSVVLDATFGGGGHSKEILEKYPNARVIALDQDESTWPRAESKFKGLEKRISFVNGNFRDLDKFEKVDAIVFDLGLSSDQLENSGRGFSFLKDEPLLMTMQDNPAPSDLTAIDIVNDWSEQSLADIIYGYGEEKYARRIAKGIAEARKEKRIRTTLELVRIIERSVPSGYKRGRIHFATRTFQALRIAVNDELRTLQTGLNKGFDILNKGGRMATISFHSLEDRIVKRFYKDKERKGEARLINKKPITGKEEEIKNNPRSRSAKLRILEKII